MFSRFRGRPIAVLSGVVLAAVSRVSVAAPPRPTPPRVVPAPCWCELDGRARATPQPQATAAIPHQKRDESVARNAAASRPVAGLPRSATGADRTKRAAGSSADTDGDGVADGLERGGYIYDADTGRFEAWNEDPNVPHWFTDPLQWSTDQDAYSDGTEASAAVMDVSVRPPGDDPLVPAYPDIVVELAGYAVTLNEEITYSEGESLAKGTTWNRSTERTASVAVERNWSLSANVETKLGAAPEQKVSFAASVGGSVTGTLSTSHAVGVGGSVLDEENWSRARSSNPTDAARIKLRIKVRNRGTASASNVVPTLTLRIGGINVATFEPGNAQVNLLVPGGVYPPEPDVHWVVDSIDTGVGIVPLSLTLNELRALERGAPISLSVTQLKADVMRADPEKGWSPAGDVGEYLARCDAVGANLRVELADGSAVHQLVHAGGARSGSGVTLKEALRRIGLRPDGTFAYRDGDGATQHADLSGHSFAFDPQTLSDNGWDLAASRAEPPAGLLLDDMVLGPATTVYIRAPRESSDVGPAIHYASADQKAHTVTLSASDYQGIAKVECFDNAGQIFRNDEDVALMEDIPGSGFYQTVVPNDYRFDGTEKVVVTNLAGQKTERTVEVVHYEQLKEPQPPVIESVYVNWNRTPPRIHANVTSPNPAHPVAWVRAYHSRLGKAKEGYVQLGEPPDSYKNPDGFMAELEGDVAKEDVLTLVAYVAPGVYTERPVAETATASLTAAANWKHAARWVISTIDFDTAKPHTSRVLDDFPKPYGGEWDLTLSAHKANALLRFTRECVRVPAADAPRSMDELFRSIDEKRIAELLETHEHINSAELTGESEDHLFVMQTETLDYVKLKIRVARNGVGDRGRRRDVQLEISYVTYAPAP